MEKNIFWLKLPIIASVVTVLLISIGFYACSNQPGSEKEKTQIKESYNDVFANSPDFFIYKMGEGYVGNIFILVDKKTRVEYFYASLDGHRMMTARIDSVGKPILYQGEFPK